MELILNENKCPTICLNMIVKNESEIITRLFDSVISIIDCYCICDTGSKDDTVQVINDYFQNKNIKGKIIKEYFKNFEYNRNYALQECLGMSDYVLLLDADMILEINNFNKNIVSDYDTITFLQGSTNFFYQNIRIVKNNGQYKYIGVTHEYIDCPDQNKNLDIPQSQLFIMDVGDGGSKSDKYERDIELLLNDIEDNPTNYRSYFYLANSYYECKNYPEAILYYLKRVEFGGWIQEVWYSYYRLGLCYKNIGNMNEAICTWLNAYDYFPERLEGLYEIIKYYRTHSKHLLCMEMCKIAFNILSQNFNRESYLFLYNDIYTYKICFEFSIIAAYIGIKNINNEIVQVLNNCTESDLINNLFKNLKFYDTTLKQKKTFILTDKTNVLLNNNMIDFYSSSSCIIKNQDKYLMNVRYVNYYIDNEGNYLNCDENIITGNKFVELTSDFKIVKQKMFNLNFIDCLYVGIEDIKIFNDIETNKFLFIGTGYHSNNTLGIVVGNYDITSNQLVSREIKPSFKESSCEKNWVFFNYNKATHLIYNWYPLQICKIDNETNLLNVVEKRKMPLLFSLCRGSTNGFQVGVSEIWFVVHLVSYEQPRHYYHLIVVFDEKMNLKRYSAPFKFEKEPIEYCLGLIIEDDKVIMSYSTWDRSTKIAVYKKQYIDSLLIYK